ncbi:hypothetical protein [Leptospira kanakyensis]|uniref:hypothetical protein n=1 Tax=Leptospira kanakyensis TaxID=2484968 RepID=UPI00223D156F|nr:hypothetical protein [Leptospira kanakyensis]MCW7470553.1 hypothetical protein [Leptospira kanakyensis]
MADKDWIKSFPRGYRSYAIQIEQGNYQTASLELENRILKRVRKECQPVIALLIEIGTDLEIKGYGQLTAGEIDKIFDEKLRDREVSCNKPIIRLAKDSFLAKILTNQFNNNLSHELVEHFLCSYINKEVTDKFHNATPKELAYSNITNKVKREIVSPRIKNLHNQVAKKVGKQLIEEQSDNLGVSNDSKAKFNFFDYTQFERRNYAN